MPDSQTPRAMPPGNWSEAFAALPDVVPPSDGWARVAQALDAPTVRNTRAWPRRRWPLWLAAAAALAMVTVVPFGLVDRDSSPPAQTSTQSAPPSAAVATGPVSRQPTSVRDVKEDPPVAHNEPRQLESTVTGDIAFVPVKPRARKPVQIRSMTTATRSSPTPAPQSATKESTSPADTTLPTGAIADAVVDPFLQLQAESAQLEALVAFARDERVASASNAILAGDLDARIGLIDAALSQPDVADAQRTALWQERIDTLRELAGVETTQRWLAARGERYDGALVRVD